MKKRNTGLIPLLILLVPALGALLMGDGLAELYHNLAFDWENATDAERTVKEYADEKGIRYSRYPKSLIDLLDRNPEAEDFVLNYPFRDSQTLETFEYDLSEGVPLLMQWDKRWGYEKYGSDMIAITGDLIDSRNTNISVALEYAPV